MDAENDRFLVNLWEVLVMVELYKAEERKVSQMWPRTCNIVNLSNLTHQHVPSMDLH